MNEETWASVDRYLADLFLPSDPHLERALESTREAGLPPIQVAPMQGQFLALLVRATGARRVLEIGTLGAYSTIWLARAMPPGGQLISLEVSPEHAAVARANLEAAGLSGPVEVRVGPAVESLAGLQAEGGPPFDFVFIDADKQGYTDYLEWSLKLTRPGSLIVADNVVRKGKVAAPPEKDGKVEGVQRFLAALAAEPRVDAAVLQTVNSKGYDGMALAVVK